MTDRGAQSSSTEAPAYTVILPAFNASATLARAIDSVLSQSFSDWQLVIVDDGSTDDTAASARSFAEREGRITLLEEPHAGVASARNKAGSEAKTEFLVFLDADDELLPDYLAEMDSFIQAHPEFDIYHPNLRTELGEGRSQAFSDRAEVDTLAFSDLLGGCVIALGGAIVRAELFRRLGGFREGVHCEDYDFWLRGTALGASALYLPKTLYVYHQDLDGRRSEDAVRGVAAAIESLETLLASGEFPEGTAPQIEAAIEDKKRLLVEAQREHVLKAQTARVTESVERVFGHRGAKPILAVLRAANRVVHPLRKAVAGSRIGAEPHADRRLKVLVVPSWYPSPENPTAGVFIRQQVQALAPMVDVAVLHIDVGPRKSSPLETFEGGIPVVRAGVPASQTRLPFGVRKTGLRAFGLLSGTWGRPDIVHVQALWPAGVVARVIKRRFGVPFVVTEHSEEYMPQSKRRLVRTPGVVGLLLRPIARAASRTIAVSRVLADRLAELGLATDPIVIPNVVPVSDPSPLPTKPPFTVAHVSIMGPAKNIAGLLAAVKQLRERRSDFRVLLVGDGECRADLEALSHTLELEDIVEFTGRVGTSEVREILAESAFTAVSSTHETFSVSAAESLMCGRPVVSTRCGGPEEFITPEVGRLVAVNDVDAIADGIDWMLDHFGEFDPEALHDYAMARFAPEVVAGQIVSVYEEVLHA
ncbi:MAG: glycosyltransferase [Coriobacteriales bacterium]|nr:glycosyltransferase [Coriobacteriales bacterium]